MRRARDGEVLRGAALTGLVVGAAVLAAGAHKRARSTPSSPPDQRSSQEVGRVHPRGRGGRAGPGEEGGRACDEASAEAVAEAEGAIALPAPSTELGRGSLRRRCVALAVDVLCGEQQGRLHPLQPLRERAVELLVEVTAPAVREVARAVGTEVERVVTAELTTQIVALVPQ